MKKIIATLLAAAILLSITAVAVSAAVRKDTEMKRADLINTITDRINEITKTKEAKKADAAAKETQAEETSEPAPFAPMGGWTYNQDDTSLDANADAKAAFEKAMETLMGVTYEPIALIGTQLVSGMNYCILCKATPITLNAGSHYALVIIYADPEGNATVTEVQDLNEDSGMGLMGGREFAELEDNAEAQIAFEKATCGLLGTNYETIALISTQTVAGTNYTFVARTTPVTPNAQASFKLVTVYADLEGNAQIIDVEEMGM